MTEHIDALVSQRTGIKTGAIHSRRQTRAVTQARYVSMWAYRVVLGWSYAEIGERFDRDHTAAMHAVRKVEARRGEDVTFRGATDALVTDALRCANIAPPAQIRTRVRAARNGWERVA